MPSLGAAIVNNRDLGGPGIGLTVTRILGPHVAPNSTYYDVEIPGRWGRSLLDLEPTSSPKIIEIQGYILAPSAATLDARIETLQAFLGRGLLEVRTYHSTTKVFYARATEKSVQVSDPQKLSRHADVRIILICEDPNAYQRLSESSGLWSSTQRAEIPIRSVHVSGVIRVWGACTNPTITIYDAGGVAMLSLPLTVTLTDDTHTLIVDNLNGNILKSVSGGTPSDIINTALVNPLHTFPLYVDPFWGDPEYGVYPTWGVSNLSTNAGAQFFYREISLT
jgi:hypothetical protein